MQVCYALASNGWDRYARMAWISANSLRRIHPHATVTLVCDTATVRSLSASCTWLFEVFDHVTSVDTPFSDAVLRSRYVKTQMRRVVSGDFLFLDVDTIVRGCLEPVFCMDADVALAVDSNNLDGYCPDSVRSIFEQSGWSWPLPRYFNSGVIFYRDTAAVRRFADEWCGRWLALTETGCRIDQPSLNSAIVETGVNVALLDPKYNAMMQVKPWLFRGCSVAHFWESAQADKTLLSHMLQACEDGPNMDWGTLEQSIKEGHPWGPNPEAWQLWASKNYVRASFRRITACFCSD